MPDKIKNNTILNQMIANQKIKLGISEIKKIFLQGQRLENYARSIV